MEYLLTSNIQSLLDSGKLNIIDFDLSMLEKDHYRFRVGEFQYKGEMVESVCLEPLEYALCLSYERFKLPNNIIGDISQISDNALDGIILNKSDYIDKFFDGKLRLGVFNMSNRVFSLKKGDAIGKIYFYKIYDEKWMGCFNEEINTKKNKTALDVRFEHRAKTDDFEESNRNLGKQWI